MKCKILFKSRCSSLVSFFDFSFKRCVSFYSYYHSLEGKLDARVFNILWNR